MAYQIRWTEPAWESFQEIIDYLESEWSFKIADKFIETTMARIDLISEQPFLGIISSSDPSIRSTILSKRNKLYYKVTGNHIILLGIFDTRKNPVLDRYL